MPTKRYALPEEHICQSAAMRRGNDDHLIVFFSSRVALRRGRYDCWDFATRLPNTQLFMREGPEMHFYLRGVPGLTVSIEETAEFLQFVKKKHDSTRVSLVGLSLGAYAATAVGHLMGADDIHAISLVSFLDKNIGERPDDSILWPEAFDDVTPLLQSGEVSPQHVDLRNIIDEHHHKVGAMKVHYGGVEPADIVHAKHVAGYPHIRHHFYENRNHMSVGAQVMGRGILEADLQATPQQMLEKEPTQHFQAAC